MRNWILVLLAFIPALVFAQSTTQEEYNYVTKGLKVQKESGLDMKKGYSLRDYGIVYTGKVNTGSILIADWRDTKVYSSGLYRDGQDKPCAIVVIYERIGFTEYLCVPSFDADQSIWDLHFAKFYGFSEDARKVITACLIKTLSFFGTKHGG